MSQQLTSDGSRGLWPLFALVIGMWTRLIRLLQCDEAKPTCTACLTRGETCHYADVPHWYVRSCLFES